ncbi:unnamed protein product, partial [Mesorhabditis belari]|uniref:Protein translocase subunit SecA n=1 Tax=Mesorhabditis belari TaxID=2138241 RepID=A0AAF3EIC2_9BILA
MITYTPESLEIGLTLRLYANSELGYEDLVLGMFQEDPKSLPKSVERRLRELYIKHQKLVIQHQGKNFIAEFVKNGDTKLIKRFLELTTNGEEAELFKGIEEAQDIQSRLEKLEELNEAKKISKSFRRYFNNQMRVFVKTGIEDEFRVILKEWLTSGEVNLKTWQQIKKWHKDGCELKTFRTMKLKDLAETDVLVHKVRDLAQRITTDEFLEPAMITKTMDRILREPTSKRVGGKVIVSSGTIFIDNWDDWFKKEVDKGAKQIEIYADNCLALMGDILIPETNLVICTSKVRVWKKSSIDLSGRSHEPKKRKARDSTSSSDNSKDGVDGQPGGSSGNLTIFTKAFVGQELLDIQLNGGRGEDGESGGDGYTGGDGKGVDWAEMRDLASFYSSLYWSYWSKYTGFEPSGWKNTYYNWNTGQQYCYKTFEDSAGRKLTLSYAGISLHWYTPTQYHLFLWVEGAEGETGTRGGKNGMGGEGGYKGECLIMNPETKQQFAVATTRLMGENGENGQPGEAGSNGKRGNDLAIIDNSAGSKVELGDTNSRLKMEWYGSEGDYRRFFGYKKHVDSESHPFIKFENGGSLSKSLLESTISTSQRSQFSKSVAQNAIITEEVLERSNENFDGESTFVEQIGLTLNDEEEEEEEEQSEEQSVEQVVVLRQADQVNLKEYTEESLKRAKPPLTASKVATAVKKTGRHGIITATAQCLFDLFQIEIDWNLLEDLRFPTLFQKNHFVHAVEEVPLQRTLIAISQNMIQKGKSYLEIHEFARSVALRRKLKFELTEKRHLSSRAIQELIGIDENYQKDLSECKNKKYLDGCRAGEPVAMGDIELKELIDSVGRDFSILYTKNEELLALQHFLKSFPSHLKVMIENNLKNDQMIWSNGDGEAFLAPYLKKAKEEENDHVDGETPQPPRQNEPLTELTEEQRKKFKNIVRGVNSEDNSERINESISLLRDLFKAEPTLAKRYGTLPKLLTENPADHQKKGKWATKLMNFVSQKDSEDEKKLTVFLIKAHFIAQEVLPFHRRLFNCNLLTKADAKELELSDFVNDLEDKDYSNFVKNLKSHTLDLSKKLCLEEMKRKRNSSSAVLYLKALADKSQITAYKLSGYKRLEECWVFKGSKETKDQNEERFVISEERAFEIEVDQDYHQFLASQQTIQEHFGLVDQKEQIPTTIQQFFEKELQPIVLEWLETFSAVAKFDQLLNFLATRFFIDGCHLSLFELQFVFSTFTHLTVECRADPKFLLTLLSTVSQTRFVDVFLYIRLCYLYGKKLEDKIWHNLRFISNPRHKIILALKLVEHKNVPSTDTLYKLILMLQHSSTDSQKLENLSMEMWIDIALKQTWAEIGSMMNEFGEAGYYLGVLASKGFTEEQKAMSSVLKSVKFIPEKLLGLFVTWICNGEFGENSLEAIRELEGLKEADDWSDEEKKGDCAKLLTNEKDQKNFFDHIGGDFLRKHEEMRTTESLKHLVVGMHDDAEMNAKVSARVEKCCDALQSLEKGEELNEICGILARFDGYLKEIEGKTLRNTQKMAVLCAVEGNGHVLEQKKLFHENCPVIKTKVDDWAKSVYDEICDQLDSERSTLVICDSIAQAVLLEEKLRKIFEAEEKKSSMLDECFKTLTMYTRSHDQFNFDGETALQPGKLLIATNLAGRGTDIKLSRELEGNGGLHVITAFMPQNARIEEQAFGRAARSGQPGSAQIIALLAERDGIKPSFFQFKMYRDNLEVQRLAELKVFYDYHTDIEETCLKKFQEHCSEVLSKVYSSKTTDSKIANPEEVVYFALLDKWALWLDEKGSEIEQCSKNNNDEERAKQKKSIVDSVKAFLDNHRLDVKEAEEKWLDFPQSQLTLALFSLCNKDLKRADRLFEKVIANDFFFAPEAYYYKACMRMAMKDLEDENYVDLVDAKKFFYYARTLLKERLESSEREATFVLQNLQQLNQKIRSNGFEVQQKANAENMQTIISNIDWLIGVPCHKEMFHSQKISKEMSFQIFGSLESDGIISPHVFTNFEPQGWMLKAVHDKFGLSNEQLKRSLVVAKASNIFFYRDTGEKHLDFGESPKVDDDNAFSIALLPILENTVKLSNRQSFYTELHESGVVKNVEQLKYANPGHETEVKLILDKKEIDPFALPTEGQHLVLNNGIQENRLYYKADDLKEIEEIEGKMMDEFIGEIDITMLRRFSYFSDFDGVQVDELAEYFEIPADGAAWLLRSLEEMGVFEQRMETRVQFTPNDELWKNKVLIFLEAKKNEEKNGNPIRAVASALENLRRIKDLQHLSIELLKYVTELKEDDDVERLYDHLMKEKLIEEYIHSCFRLNSRLDVSSLPASISDQVGLYLMSKFAYSFALERLCVDIDNGNAQKVMFHSIFLPEYPHKQFFDSLKSQEVISSQRIVSKEYQNIDEDLFEELDEIKGTLREHASKLLDQTGYHLTLLPLENYILGRSETLNSEIRFVSDKGLKLVVGVGESGLGWKILTNVVGAVVTAVRTAVSKIKAFGSWAYGIGSSIVHWVGDNIVDPVANKINKVAMKVGKACSYVKGKVSEFTQWVANSEAFKAASSCVKSTCGAIAAVGGAIVGAVGDAVTKVGKVIGRAAYQLGEMTGINDNIRKIAAAGRAIGNKVKEAAEWVAEKAVQLYEGAKREAVKAFEWVSETKLVKWAKSAGKAVIDFGKNVYQKMSNFISAVMESYEYYNQCRFYAKKIAVESQSSSVDEYTILRTYVNARQATACEEEGDETFRQKLQTHLVLSFEKAYARLDKVIYESVMKEICEYNLPLDLQSKLATIETFIKVSPSTQNFKSEVEEKFMIEASKVAIKFGYLMTEFATNDAPFESMEMPDLETEFTFGRLEGIVRKTVQDFANYQKLELKEKDGDDGSLTKRFIAKFAIELGKLIGEYCRAIYIDKPTKDLTAFMVELRKPGKVAEVADFEGEDLKLKRALAHCNAQIKEKRQNQGLLKELLRIVHQKVVDDVGVLKVALKFGYPLPICCLERIVPVLERVVEAPLRIQLAKREYGNGSALEVIRVDHIDDSLFISSRDYLRYKRIGVGNEEEETSVNSFLFDALQRRFPLKEQLKEREIFRNYLIQSL